MKSYDDDLKPVDLVLGAKERPRTFGDFFAERRAELDRIRISRINNRPKGVPLRNTAPTLKR